MNTNNIVRKTAAFALVGMFAAIIPLGAQTVWEGTDDNDWNTAGNWSNGVPTSGTAVTIALDGANVTMSAAGNAGATTVSGGGVTAPTLNITQNLTLSTNMALTVGSNSSLAGYGGVVNHTAGTVQTQGTGRLDIAAKDSSATGQSGTYNFGGDESTAPSLTVAGETRIGQTVHENGTLSMSGYGTINTFLKMSHLNGTSLLRIEGGNLNINLLEDQYGSGLRMGHTGGGTATIQAVIDGTGFSTINVAGNVFFGTPSRFVLELGSGYVHAPGTEFVILDATGDFTANGVFSRVNGSVYTPGASFFVDGNEFSAAYLTGESVNSQFVVTAIPEPSTLVLFGLAGLACLSMMRRRKSA